MDRDTRLLDLIVDRLARKATPTATADVVLAALGGDRDLAAVMAGASTATLSAPAAERATSERVYLSSVTASGFRGVGASRTLTVRPGPGLTLVVGRNGSGKSTFAEATELALTGDSARWSDRNSVWRTGWRNLHEPDPCRIAVELRVDGRSEPVRVARSWAAGAKLDGATAEDAELRGLGLAEALAHYRPFLTPAELGMLISGTPSKLFDAINVILGLDLLTDADKRLLAATRPVENTIEGVRAQRTLLRGRLGEVDDDRARRAAAALGAGTPDLDVLDAIAVEPLDTVEDRDVALCRWAANLAVPSTEDVTGLADELSAAVEEARLHDGEHIRTLTRTAELLRLALEHHDDRGDGPCPVCDTGTLDAPWRTTATSSLDQLRTGTLAAQRAAKRLADAMRRARVLLDGLEVPDGDVAGVRLDALREAVAALRAAPSAPADVAAHLRSAYPAVATAAEDVRAEAAEWLRGRDSGWRLVAEELRAWVGAARQLPAHESRLAALKAARVWLRDAGNEIRNERLAPFAEHSQRIWQELRQDSNVQLGAMTLTGANTTRKLVFPVSVDDADNGTALGVMSQGELQALGLALFLPRSCAEESPFRFVIIDDPVQSMDPSKVDGLARVLAGLAADRQVIVFTHDPRLPDAVRRLEIDAAVIEVFRAERSVVTLRAASDPVARYLDDARAVAHSTEVADNLRAPVVAELCRSALEAACHRVVWRVRVGRGVPHSDIEAALDGAGKRLTTLMALALCDDSDKGGDVLSSLNRIGRWAGDVYVACRKGVHHSGYVADLPRLVNDTRKLTEELR